MAVLFSFMVFAIGYSSYFFISRSLSIQKRLRHQFEGKDESLIWTVFQRSVGVVCLGLFPGILVLSLSFWRFSDLGMGLILSRSVLFWSIGLGICVLVISYLFSKNPKNFQIYPQVRDNLWTIKTVGINTGSWLAYLVAYEFLFRGLLLFTLSSALGEWPAIVITTCLYVLVHIPKGLKEALGAIPFGLALGWITIEAGSFWPAFFIHAMLALSSDYFAILANPDKHFRLLEK